MALKFKIFPMSTKKVNKETVPMIFIAPRAYLLHEKSKISAILVPKQILCASNIESIQTKLCFDLFFRKQIFYYCLHNMPSKRRLVISEICFGTEKAGLLDLSYNKCALDNKL